MAKNLKWTTRAMLKLADITDAEVTSIETDKGKLYLVDADQPDVDVEVYVEDEQGIRMMPEDGVYTYDGFQYTIVDGVITEKRDANAEPEAPAELGEAKHPRLKLEAELPEVIEVVNELAEAIASLEVVVEEIGGDTSDVPPVEELAAVKAQLSKMENLSEKTLLALEEMGKRANANFLNPDPKNEGKKKPGLSAKEVLDYYKKQ